MRESKAASLSQVLSESLAGNSILEVGQAFNLDSPTVFGVESDESLIVHCPMCNEPHVHGKFEQAEFRSANCGLGGYWVIPVGMNMKVEGKRNV